jgi:hypothetical protein
MLVPLLTGLIMGALNFSALLTLTALGPAYYSNVLRIEYLPLTLIISLLLSIIIVVVFLPPKRFDQFIDWWYGL